MAGFRSESSTGWNEVQNRASNYGFTNGVINTNPTIGGSALSDNRAKFLPEPRVGVAYDVFGNGGTALRASFGVHKALLDTLDYRLDQTAPFNTTLSFSNTTVDKLAGLADGSTSGSGLISPSNVQPDIATPTVLAWTLKLEQQIAPATSLTIGYVGSHGYNQILSEDQNTPLTVVCPAASCPAAPAPGTIYYPTTVKANPNVANTTSWVSQGISNYNALEVDVRKQLSHGLQLRGIYTWASNLDDGWARYKRLCEYSGLCNVPRKSETGLWAGGDSIRNAAAISGTWELPFGQTVFAGRFCNAPDHRRMVSQRHRDVAERLSFSPQLGYNPTGNGDTRNPVRPNDFEPDFHGSLYSKSPASGSTRPPYGALSRHFWRWAETRSLGQGWRISTCRWRRAQPFVKDCTLSFVRNFSTSSTTRTSLLLTP